ncbi:uncharacterized protein PG986_013120 [Apiospora aurea]|uniref:NACHT domain-containing protein n=1 Tax=Apiospora aurea TaxID=335848 RepID=A0ABR1PUY9_9PEZI
MTAALESENGSEEPRATHIQIRDAISNSKWAQAVQSLSDDDREQFGIAQPSSGQDPLGILEDVLAATEAKKEEPLNKRWKVTVKGRTIIIRDVLEKMTLWVNKRNLKAIGSLALQYDPTGAALPWAAIKLFMQAAVNDVEIFAYTLTALEKITNIIGRSQIFEQLYLNQQSAISPESVVYQLSASVIRLYATILQYLAGVMRYYRTGTVIRFLKSTAKTKADLEGEFRRLEEAQVETLRLAQLAEAQKSEAVALPIANMEEKQSKLDENNASRFVELRESCKNKLDRESRVKILRAISTIPYATHHKVASQGRLPGSRQWLLNKEVYTSWRASSSSSVLWLHGIPGSGKTKLATLVVDDLKASEHIAFFYCMRNPSEPFRTLCQPILASLVRQLASVDPSKPLLPPVVSQYQDALDDYIGFEDQSWTVDDCRRVLTELSNEYPAVTIVVDALDEVDGEDRQELMDALGELIQESTSLVKIFISSRDNADIALSLQGSPNVYIEADDNAIDIEAFIIDQLEKAKLLRGKLPATLRKKISDTLLSGAKGMFRWVELQIQSLRKLKVAADIKARLGHLPETLEGAYWEVYQQILASGENAAKLAIFTFQWLLYAQQTIPLESFSRFASIALSDDPGIIYDSHEIVDVCSNLIVSRSDSFQFAHLSVREFLEHLQKRQVTTMMAGDGHAALARASLLQLQAIASVATRLGLDRTQRCRDLVNPQKPIDRAPSTPEEVAMDDAGRWILDHPLAGDHSDEEPSSDEDPRDRDTSDEVLITTSAEDQAIVKGGEAIGDDVFESPMVLATRYAVTFWPYHMTASNKLRSEPHLRQLSKLFLVDSAERTVAPGFTIWCRLLIHVEDKPDYPDLWDPVDVPPTPLWLICIYNWPELVDDLHEANYEDMECHHEIKHAEKYGLHGGELIMTPLLYAVTAGHNELVQGLISCRSELPASLQVGSRHQEETSVTSPLYRATSLKKTELVVLLLDNGYGSTDTLAEAFGLERLSDVFVVAVTNDYRDLVSILQEHNAQKDPFAVVEQIFFGAETSALKLIEASWDIHGRYLEKRRTALHYAAEKGHVDAVAALLKRRVAVDIFDRSRNTPLHLAAWWGRDKCVELLLSHGADVLAEDRYENIALDLAEKRHHPSTARIIRGAYGTSDGGASVEVEATVIAAIMVQTVDEEGSWFAG